MNLTIEKAKEIVNHPENYCDIGPFGHAQIWKAKGFIEGWNQAIEKVIEEMNLKPKPYTVSGIIEREELKFILNSLKVKGEK